MTKQYIKGYNYQVHSASLIMPTMLVLSNELKYGQGRLEAQIMVDKGQIRVLITDGYSFLYDKTGFQGIKAAMNIAHGRMESMSK